MKRKNVKRWISVTAIALCMTVTAAGCRPSPVLEDVVYTEDATVLDPEHQTYESALNEEEEDARQDKKDEAAGRRDDTETESVGKSDSDGSADINSRDIRLGQDIGDEVDSHKSDGDGSGQDKGIGDAGSGIGSGNNGNAAGDSSGGGSGTKNPDPEDENQTPPNENPEEKNQMPPDNTQQGDNISVPSKVNVPKKVVTNGNGEEVVIPEDVHTVTAVGPVAAIVEMLGGEGRLLGSSESFTENDLSQTMFADIDDIHTWWEDAGETSISDENFQELLQESPDVCFELSGQNTFTEEQVARLQELGIGYLVLPELSTTDDLKDAVTIVANALATNETTGKSAKTIASNYRDWVDSVIDEVKDVSSNTFYGSVYIAEWRDDISFKLTSGSFPTGSGQLATSGSGVAVAWTSNKKEMISSLMKTAGVINVTTETGQFWGGDGGTIWKQQYREGREGVYIFPISYWPLSYTNIILDSEEYIMPLNGWYVTYGIAYLTNTTTSSGSPLCYRLGETQFPAIIVADKNIKSKIENTYLWQYHSYEEMKNDWPDIVGDIPAITFQSQTDIVGSYKIYVSPSGIDSWADGSVESPLEAYWVANKFSGTISESLLLNRMRSFYKTFFGVTLSDSQLKKMIG